MKAHFLGERNEWKVLRQTHGENNLKMSRGKESQQLPETGRNKNRVPAWSFQRECSLVCTLSLDFWPLEVGQNKFLWFYTSFEVMRENS